MTTTHIKTDIPALASDPTIAVSLAAAAARDCIPYSSNCSHYGGYGLFDYKYSRFYRRPKSLMKADESTRGLMDAVVAVLSRNSDDKIACALHIHNPDSDTQPSNRNPDGSNTGMFEFILASNNGPIDEAALDHLRDIWSDLVRLSQLFADGNNNSDSGSRRSSRSQVRKTWNFTKRKIYTFCMPSFYSTFTKNASLIFHWYTGYTKDEQRRSSFDLGQDEEEEKEREVSDNSTVDVVKQLKAIIGDIANCLELLHEAVGIDDSTYSAVPSAIEVKDTQKLDQFILGMRRLLKRIDKLHFHSGLNIEPCRRNWNVERGGPKLQHCLQDISRFVEDVAWLWDFAISDKLHGMSDYC